MMKREGDDREEIGCWKGKGKIKREWDDKEGVG